MKIDDFINKFAMQFETLDNTVLTPDTEFKGLNEWSSLMALNIIAMVDDEYGIAIKGTDIRVAETIEDLFNTVKSQYV